MSLLPMKRSLLTMLVLSVAIGTASLCSADEAVGDREYQEESNDSVHRIVKEIVIEGNSQVSGDAILDKVPYRKGAVYNPLLAGKTIRSVMEMGYFKNVIIEGEYEGEKEIILYVVVEEKKPLQEIIFKGNKNFKQKDIEKKIDFSAVPAVDEVDLKSYALAIERLYKEKNYHDARVTAEIEDKGEKAVVIFNVEEGKKTTIKRVFFIGNKTFSGKTLRSLIFTREDWPLSFMDKSGTYQPDAVESDRFTIENFYQSNGFLNAKVTDVEVKVDPLSKEAEAIFHIHEGDVYRISEIHVAGANILTEEQILAFLPLRPNQLYSREVIRQTMEVLRALWGKQGYIYVDVVPSIEPDDDSKTVKVSFFVESGDKVYVNKINITGNKKSRDKIIRRQLLLSEGDLITTNNIDESKRRIENLGYFDQREGVNWKLSRINEEYADVDIFVNEVKTGRLEGQLGFGGSPKDLQSPATSMRLVGSFSDTNLLGLGLGFNVSGAYSKEERQLLFNITDPWLFDRPIYGAIDIALKRSVYEEFKFVTDDIHEEMASGSLSLGFISKRLNGTKFIGQLGAEGIHYSKQPEVKQASLIDPIESAEFSAILLRRFPQGAFGWVGLQAGQDFRNHPTFPTCGYQWVMQSKLGFPGWSSKFGFWKIDWDGSWYTPLIGERTLVLCLHGHFGIVNQFPGKEIPFRELYHIGGPSSVRGFLFGQIGPTFKGIDSLGAKKALWFNAELVFPIAPDYSIKGAIFYDGGSGWDTPNSSEISPLRLRNNNFDYRHSIGFGFRVLRPTPLKVDWGFKLDRRRGESASEVHLSMAHDF